MPAAARCRAGIVPCIAFSSRMYTNTDDRSGSGSRPTSPRASSTSRRRVAATRHRRTHRSRCLPNHPDPPVLRFGRVVTVAICSTFTSIFLMLVTGICRLDHLIDDSLSSFISSANTLQTLPPGKRHGRLPGRTSSAPWTTGPVLCQVPEAIQNITLSHDTTFFSIGISLHKGTNPPQRRAQMSSSKTP